MSFDALMQRCAGLLASVLMAHRVQLVILLKAGNEDTEFVPKPTFATSVSAQSSERLLLSCLRQLASLYQSLMSGESLTRPIRRASGYTASATWTCPEAAGTGGAT